MMMPFYVHVILHTFWSRPNRCILKLLSLLRLCHAQNRFQVRHADIKNIAAEDADKTAVPA